MKEKVLILGGTKFIGRYLVERLLQSDNHEVTLFNRQVSNADIFPQCNKLKGDRSTVDIEQVGENSWDYVVDLSCYHPAQLESLLANLKTPPKRFIFVSTCSVYDNGIDQTVLRKEEAPILSCSADEADHQSDSTYGHRKAECERLLGSSGLDHLILRPSLVYGRYDYTDRFYYWLYQVKFNSPILLPDNVDRKFAITYVNDLASAIVESMTSVKPRTIYTITSTPQISIRTIVEHASSILGIKPDFRSASAEFLNENNIRQWVDMPLWLDCEYYTYDNQRIKSDFDLAFTKLQESVKETIEYFDEIGWAEPTYGISEETRKSLLEKL